MVFYRLFQQTLRDLEIIRTTAIRTKNDETMKIHRTIIEKLRKMMFYRILNYTGLA